LKTQSQRGFLYYDFLNDFGDIIIAFLDQKGPFNGTPHFFSTMHSSSQSFASFSNGSNTTTTVDVHTESAESTTCVFPSSVQTGSVKLHHHRQAHVKNNASAGMEQDESARLKTMQTRPPSRLQGHVDPSFYNRARRPALIPHTSSLSLAEASEIISKRIGTPLLPPPDPHRISTLTSHTSAPGSHSMYTSRLEDEVAAESRYSKKRKHSVHLLDGESSWSCGVHGCGEKTDAFHLSMLGDEEIALGFLNDSPFRFAKGQSKGWASAGGVSPLSSAVLDIGMAGVPA
jgi:hypothetical protein